MEAPRNGQTFMAVDAGGTVHLSAAAARAGVGRLVYISGAGASPQARHVRIETPVVKARTRQLSDRST